MARGYTTSDDIPSRPARRSDSQRGGADSNYHYSSSSKAWKAQSEHRHVSSRLDDNYVLIRSIAFARTRMQRWPATGCSGLLVLRRRPLRRESDRDAGRQREDAGHRAEQQQQKRFGAGRARARARLLSSSPEDVLRTWPQQAVRGQVPGSKHEGRGGAGVFSNIARRGRKTVPTVQVKLPTTSAVVRRRIENSIEGTYI